MCKIQQWCGAAEVSGRAAASGVVIIPDFDLIAALAFHSGDPWDLSLWWVDPGAVTATQVAGYASTAIPVADVAAVERWSDIYPESIRAIEFSGAKASLFYEVSAVGTPTNPWYLSVHGGKG